MKMKEFGPANGSDASLVIEPGTNVTERENDFTYLSFGVEFCFVLLSR